MDKFINAIVEEAVFKFATACPSVDTVRCVRIMVAAMFNWTSVADEGAVGFQIQQMAQMLMTDEERAEGMPLHLFGQVCNTFRQQHNDYQIFCAAENVRRREEFRARVLARQSATA